MFLRNANVNILIEKHVFFEKNIRKKRFKLQKINFFEKMKIAQLYTFLLILSIPLSSFAQTVKLDSLKSRYDSRSIMLLSNGYMRDGSIYRYGLFKENLRPLFNTVPESADQFKKYRRNTFTAIATSIGAGVCLGTASFYSLDNKFNKSMLFLGLSVGLSISSSITTARANDNLQRAAWYYNRYQTFH